MLLTPDELAELTDRPQPKRQIEWLTVRGWVFEIGASGRPKVTRSYAESRLAGGKAKAFQEQPRWDKV